MTSAINFEKVSKRYILGSQRAYGRFLLAGLFPQWVRRPKNQQEGQIRPEELWALRDVSFQVNEGETLGLIGPNGAGKTTILSLLAGIISPCTGDIQVRGRLSALIQLGAGFHPELTGRENIYLNGSIMGLKKKEIDRRLDEIIAFSELEQFIDTPIKRYSSGMNVRLGFAVAAHIEPEILLIDEVLAVGDVSFKSKCYQKIRDLHSSGTTVILVSHDMSQVKNLSDRAILLFKGMIRIDGSVDEAIQEYYEIGLSKVKMPDRGRLVDNETVRNHNLAEILDVTFTNGNGNITDNFKTGDLLKAKIRYQAREEIVHPAFGISIHNRDGIVVIGINTKLDDYKIDSIQGEGIIEFTIPNIILLPGTYLVSVVLHDQYMGSYDRHPLKYHFTISKGPVTSGIVLPDHYWELNPRN